MRPLEYHIYHERIHIPTAMLPVTHYELVSAPDDLTDYRPQLISTHSDLSDAMIALADLQCTASMIDDDVCQADLYCIQQIEVVNKELDHYLFTGNRWYAKYNPDGDKDH